MKHRVTLKIATVTSVTLLCLGFAISLYFKLSITERAEEFDLYTLVPTDSQVIIDTDDMAGLMQRIDELGSSKDGLYLHFSRFFSYLKENIDDVLEQAPHGLSKQMNKMLISIHEPDNELNQVYYCRLGAGDYDFIEQLIRKNFAETFPSRIFEYKGEEIHIYPTSDDFFLACYVSKEFLVISYQKKLIEQVIDAKLSKKSILSDEVFATMRDANRMVSPVTIYSRMREVKMGKESGELAIQSSLGNWAEFNVNLNGEAVYLSGISYDVDSMNTFINTLRAQQPIEGFPEKELPASTFFFSKLSVSDLQRVLDFTSGHSYVPVSDSVATALGDIALSDFLRDYAGGTVTACMFYDEDSLVVSPHAVISVPIQNTSRIKKQLKALHRAALPQRRGAASEINYFFTKAQYAYYELPPTTMPVKLTGVTDSSLRSYACLHNGNILISPHVSGLKAYIELIEEADSLFENTSVYERVTTALSTTYHYVMMADMENVLQQPGSYVRFVPHFFFRHSDFFRHFVLAAQLNCVDDMVYPTLIFFYKSEEPIEEELLEEVVS